MVLNLSRAARIVWIDLEMTGLDPEVERVLEIATIVTDGELELVAEGPELTVCQPEALLATMDEWNRTHHAESGLIERVRSEGLTVEEAEARTLEFLSRYCDPNTAPLAGNSIWQDRRFLAREMRGLDAFLHYRMIDVSSVKELARRWYPNELAAAPEKKGAHRALEDIRESIEELRYYRRTLFR